jgi:hypothetical protein
MRFTTFPILLLALVASVVVADDEHTPNRYKCDTAGRLDCDTVMQHDTAYGISTSKSRRLRGTIEQRG